MPAAVGAGVPVSLDRMGGPGRGRGSRRPAVGWQESARWLAGMGGDTHFMAVCGGALEEASAQVVRRLG